MKLPKNIQILITKTQVVTVTLTILFCTYALLTKKWPYIYSAITGLIFSHLWLKNLIETQWITVQKSETKIVFPRFLFRLVFVATPIILSLKFSKYLLIEIILIFLFTSHISYILIELMIRIKKNKARKNKE